MLPSLRRRKGSTFSGYFQRKSEQLAVPFGGQPLALELLLELGELGLGVERETALLDPGVIGRIRVVYLAGGLAMAALIRLSYIWLGLSWKSLAIQVAGGGIIYVIVVLLLRDRFALEVLGIFLRHTPFGKKRT